MYINITVVVLALIGLTIFGYSISQHGTQGELLLNQESWWGAGLMLPAVLRLAYILTSKQD